MKINELQPLLEKVACLKNNPSTQEVFLFVNERVEGASTPTMGQSACEAIASMCNPRAWGDLNVQNFGTKWSDWFAFLEELEAIAYSCGQAIYDNCAKQ